MCMGSLPYLGCHLNAGWGFASPSCASCLSPPQGCSNTCVLSVFEQSCADSLCPPPLLRSQCRVPSMRVAGLTGGIASGKSTATRLFRKEGISVIDCDEAARYVVRQVIVAMQAAAGLLVKQNQRVCCFTILPYREQLGIRGW